MRAGQNPPQIDLAEIGGSEVEADIDIVGDATHNTLFEMLGNFSIGDYFKEGAISFALEFMTQNMGLPVDRLHATIYLDDDEARQLWLDAGFPDERISRHGDEDNWWGPAGLEGPCGPSSEIHYDLGTDKGCLQSDCAPNCTNVMNEHGDECNRGEELHGETPESGQGRMKRRGVECGAHGGGAAPLTPKVYG